LPWGLAAMISGLRDGQVERLVAAGWGPAAQPPGNDARARSVPGRAVDLRSAAPIKRRTPCPPAPSPVVAGPTARLPITSVGPPASGSPSPPAAGGRRTPAVRSPGLRWPGRPRDRSHQPGRGGGRSSRPPAAGPTRTVLLGDWPHGPRARGVGHWGGGPSRCLTRVRQSASGLLPVQRHRLRAGSSLPTRMFRAALPNLTGPAPGRGAHSRIIGRFCEVVDDHKSQHQAHRNRRITRDSPECHATYRMPAGPAQSSQPSCRGSWLVPSMGG
jgi:hypothetical protein